MSVQQQSEDSNVTYIPPNEILRYRGLVDGFSTRKGFGFITIKALIREHHDVIFDYNWLQPLSKIALVHYSDIVTGPQIERDEKDVVSLEVGQIVYFNLTLNDRGRYKAINVLSETITTSSAELEVTNMSNGDKNESRKSNRIS